MRCFILILCIALQACQPSAKVKAEQAETLEKKHNAVAYNIQLGTAYLKQGDTSRAKQKLLKALKLEPSSPEATVAMAYFLEKTGELKEAQKYYLKSISLAPGSGAQLNNYGTFLCRTGKYKEAESYFLKAVKDVDYVNSAGAYENAGLCAAADHNFAKAEEFFNAALLRDPHRKQSLYEMVLIQINQNNAEKALASLIKYRALVDNNQTLLQLGVKAAQKAENATLAANYELQLNKLTNPTDYNTGETNEYNSTS